MSALLTILIVAASIGLIAITTMSFVGGVYANRSALPVVAVMFVAVLVFGALW